MTREQLEANWGWSPTEGSIPFPRPRLTAKNIRDQKRLARPGTLIHWSGKPCARGVWKIDATITEMSNCRLEKTALAGHIENVNCLQCRANYFGTRFAQTPQPVAP